MGAFSDIGGSYTIREFARMVRISRRALLNDDLGAFEQALASFGRALALLENSLVITALQGVALGANVMEDNLPLFHSTHNNTTTATILSVPSLSEALRRMREQTAHGTASRLNLTPSILLVPATVEVLARQLTSALTPATTAGVNPFSESSAVPLEVIVDANLATTHAFLCAAPTSTASALELTTGPANAETMSQWDLETTGMNTRVLADRGLGVKDFRGICRIPLS
jgi:phage major head subunit gpT-like protein